MANQIEYKALAWSVKADEDEEGVIFGEASTFGNVDYQNDVVDKGAFRKTLKENPHIVILNQHDPADPIGIHVEGKETDTGLSVRGKLNMQLQSARDVMSNIQMGIIRALSIGYRTIKDDMDRTTGVRHLKELHLLEYSPVTFPANPKTSVYAKAERMIHDARYMHPDELRLAVKELTALLQSEPDPSTLSEQPQPVEEPEVIDLHSMTEMFRQFNLTNGRL
jgi:uncharacterized protein